MKTICVDMGGTRTKVAIVEDGKVGESVVFPSAPDFATTRAELARRIHAYLEASPGNWRGLGLSTPGLVDEAAGCVTQIVGSHAGLANFDLRAWSRETFGLELRVLNDARAALLGEVTFGCARGERDAVAVTLGTGVGTAVMLDGWLPRGRHNSFGLLNGHIPVKMDGRDCPCGGCGCFESYVGTSALKALTGDPTYDYRRFEADWSRGEPRARELFDVVARALGVGTLSLVHAYDVEAVVYTGGASRFTALVAAAEDYVWRHVYTPWGKVRFAVSDHPELSGILGAHAVWVE